VRQTGLVYDFHIQSVQFGPDGAPMMAVDFHVFLPGKIHPQLSTKSVDKNGDNPVLNL
jgi:hypothetical protein